jgi:hypothetical protein
MNGPIELMNFKSTFIELKECTGKEACSILLSSLNDSPFNLVRNQLLTFRGNGPYGGRFYYDWKSDSKVTPPLLKPLMSSRGLSLKWSAQKTVKSYEVAWNTINQACNQFVPLI